MTRPIGALVHLVNGGETDVHVLAMCREGSRMKLLAEDHVVEFLVSRGLYVLANSAVPVCWR